MTLMTKTVKKTLLGSFDMVIELLTQACCHTDVELAGIPYHTSTADAVNIIRQFGNVLTD